VERKEGERRYRGHTLKVVDLPGVYSLTAYSLDEVIARNFVVEEHPDVTVDVVDATNLERNLYLAVQLREMGVPLILALNMMDMVESRGQSIDTEELARLLGVRIVPLVASRGQGIESLLEEILEMGMEQVPVNGFKLTYGREVDQEVSKLEEMISQTELAKKYPPKWLAIKLLEDDEEVVRMLRVTQGE
jgi:ferrous iron transport protein B